MSSGKQLNLERTVILHFLGCFGSLLFSLNTFILGLYLTLSLSFFPFSGFWTGVKGHRFGRKPTHRPNSPLSSICSAFPSPFYLFFTLTASKTKQMNRKKTESERRMKEREEDEREKERKMSESQLIWTWRLVGGSQTGWASVGLLYYPWVHLLHAASMAAIQSRLPCAALWLGFCGAEKPACCLLGKCTAFGMSKINTFIIYTTCSITAIYILMTKQVQEVNNMTHVNTGQLLNLLYLGITGKRVSTGASSKSTEKKKECQIFIEASLYLTSGMARGWPLTWVINEHEVKAKYALTSGSNCVYIQLHACKKS